MTSHKPPTVDYQDHWLPKLPYEPELVPPVSCLAPSNQIQYENEHLSLDELVEKADHLSDVDECAFTPQVLEFRSSTSAATLGCFQSEDPYLIITPEAGVPLPHYSLMIGGHVSGVELPHVLHRHVRAIHELYFEQTKLCVCLTEHVCHVIHLFHWLNC